MVELVPAMVMVKEVLMESKLRDQKATHIIRGTFNKDTVRDSPTDDAKIVTVRLAKVGVRDYEYMDADGNWFTMREAILPEQLFSEDTMASAEGAYVTYYHPWRLLDSVNWDIYTKGVTIGKAWVEDNMYLVMDVKIFDKDLQAYVLSGLADGCSIGYSQEFVWQPGEINGEAYDGYNSNIRINHVAFCDRADARGGEDLGLKLDTICKSAIDSAFRADTNTNIFSQLKKHTIDQNDPGSSPDQKPREDVNMATYNLNGKTFEVPEEIAARLDALGSENEGLRAQLASANTESQSRLDTITGERDATRAELEAERAKVADLQARLDAVPTEEGILKAISLAGFVSKITGVEESHRTDSKELMLKALTKMYPNENFDTKSEAYLEARMDVLKENLERDGYPTVMVSGSGSAEEVRTDTMGIDATGAASNHYTRTGK